MLEFIIIIFIIIVFVVVVNLNSVELYRRSRITGHITWKSLYSSLNSRKR